MSFKVNDYNNFLTSLYEKESANNNAKNIQSNASNNANLNPGQKCQPLPDLSGKKDHLVKSEFPMDFDFGLLPNSVTKSPDELLQPEFTLENSLPDQNFDLFIPREDNSLFRLNSQLSSNSHMSPDTQIENSKNLNFLAKNSSINDSPSSRKSNSSISKNGSLTNENTTNTTTTTTNNTNIPSIHGPGRPRAKSSHNLIEQRYRNKINDRFESLQDCVPTLRVVARKLKKEEEDSLNGETEDKNDSEEAQDDQFTDLEGLEPARKLSKGTILTKSVEYIKFLESKNLRLKQQQEELFCRARMMGIDISDDFKNIR